MSYLRSRQLSFILQGLILLGLPLLAYSAEMAAGCHCFRNRTFDPANTFVADDYLLTTTSNSLMAGHFNISKRKIIMMKMQGGASNNDLLIGLHIAAVSNTNVSRVLALREQSEKNGGKSWQDTLQSTPELSRTGKSDTLLQLIRDGLSDEQAGNEITNSMLHDRFRVAPALLRDFQKNGLSSPETVLILTLADYTGTDPGTILSLHKNGLSWSAIAHNFGLAPVDVGKLLIPSLKD